MDSGGTCLSSAFFGEGVCCLCLLPAGLRALRPLAPYPGKLSSSREKKPQKQDCDPPLIFQVETLPPPSSNKGFCYFALRKCSPLSAPPGMDEVLPDVEMLSPRQGAQGTISVPRLSLSPGFTHAQSTSVGDSHTDLLAMGSKEGRKNPPQDNLHQLPELGFSLWLNARRKNSINNKHLQGEKKQSETGLAELLCCGK